VFHSTALPAPSQLQPAGAAPAAGAARGHVLHRRWERPQADNQFKSNRLSRVSSALIHSVVIGFAVHRVFFTNPLHRGIRDPAVEPGLNILHSQSQGSGERKAVADILRLPSLESRRTQSPRNPGHICTTAGVRRRSVAPEVQRYTHTHTHTHTHTSAIIAEIANYDTFLSYIHNIYT
jgi:hypothetical protein